MIWNRLERYRDLGLLVARLGFGLGFLWFHGWSKLTAGPDRWAGYGASMQNFGIDFAPTFWGFLAAFSESIGGLLIASGLFFRPAAAMIMGVMIVATTNHFVSGQGSPAHSFKNAWLFAGLILIGPGRYSIDHWLERRRASASVDSESAVAARA